MTSKRPTFGIESDLKETDEAYVYQLDLPGFDEGDITTVIDGARLVVNGMRKPVERDEEGVSADGSRWHTMERKYGFFSRSFDLPSNVLKPFTATFDQGVLSIAFRKETKMNSLSSPDEL